MRYVLLVAALTIGCTEPTPDENSLETALEEFKNREIHKSLDVETLQALPDGKVEQAIVDYVDHKIEAGSVKNLESLAPGTRALWLTWMVEQDLSSFGFSEYFWKTEGRYGADTVDAFEFFSAKKLAEVMRKANAIRAEGVANIKEYGTWEAYDGSEEARKLGELDEQFFEFAERSDLRALRIAKIRKSPELFTGD